VDKLQPDPAQGKLEPAITSPSTSSLVDALPGDQRPIDVWMDRAVANVKLMSTDESYRRHIGLLALGDPSAWRRHRETIASAETGPCTRDPEAFRSDGSSPLSAYARRN